MAHFFLGPLRGIHSLTFPILSLSPESQTRPSASICSHHTKHHPSMSISHNAHTLPAAPPVPRKFIRIKSGPPPTHHVAQHLPIQTQSHKSEWCDRFAVRNLVQDAK
jgi:hypothetical protein